MKNIDFAVEKGFRYFFENINYFHFFMIQLRVTKSDIKDGKYHFLLRSSDTMVFKNSDTIVFKNTIIIDSKNECIVTPGSHEDPLVQTQNDYLICLQLPAQQLDKLQDLNLEVCLVNQDNKIILEWSHIDKLKEAFEHYQKNHFSNLIKDYEITTQKDCVFRLHLGDFKANYQEKEFILKKHEVFNFKKYLKDYPYIGLQCSYENETPEIEEKHIVIGQKGMTLSGQYFDGNHYYEALLPFDKKYQILYSPVALYDKGFADYIQESWSITNSLDEILSLYQKQSEILFFESSDAFLDKQYREKLTYGLLKNYSTKELKLKRHLDLEVCAQCKNNHKCIQMVPSNLSFDLFKENILINNENDCRFYQLIENIK